MGICSKLDTLSVLCFKHVITQHEQRKKIEVLNKDEFWESNENKGRF